VSGINTDDDSRLNDLIGVPTDIRMLDLYKAIAEMEGITLREFLLRYNLASKKVMK
jgi:hypothetical protein